MGLATAIEKLDNWWWGWGGGGSMVLADIISLPDVAVMDDDDIGSGCFHDAVPLDDGIR